MLLWSRHPSVARQSRQYERSGCFGRSLGCRVISAQQCIRLIGSHCHQDNCSTFSVYSSFKLLSNSTCSLLGLQILLQVQQHSILHQRSGISAGCFQQWRWQQLEQYRIYKPPGGYNSLCLRHSISAKAGGESYLNIYYRSYQRSFTIHVLARRCWNLYNQQSLQTQPIY